LYLFRKVANSHTLNHQNLVSVKGAGMKLGSCVAGIVEFEDECAWYEYLLIVHGSVCQFSDTNSPHQSRWILTTQAWKQWRS